MDYEIKESHSESVTNNWVYKAEYYVSNRKLISVIVPSANEHKNPYIDWSAYYTENDLITAKKFLQAFTHATNLLKFILINGHESLKPKKEINNRYSRFHMDV